jgi:sorbitol-specific phosphotransferase system component IIBC
MAAMEIVAVEAEVVPVGLEVEDEERAVVVVVPAVVANATLTGNRVTIKRKHIFVPPQFVFSTYDDKR